MKETKKCLREAILGERGAMALYKAFAVKATEEGFPNVAKLFKTLIKAEHIHVHNHLSALGEDFDEGMDTKITDEIMDTAQNVKSALTGEQEEAAEMYPRFNKIIRKEGRTTFYQVAELSVQWAAKAEKVHAKLLKMTLKSLKKGQDLPVDTFFVCRVCGSVEIGELEGQSCKVCGHDKDFFTEVK